MSGSFTDAQVDRSTAICDAVLSICLNDAGLDIGQITTPRDAYRQGFFPLGKEITKFPFLVVEHPQMVGYVTRDRGVSQELPTNESGVRRFLWDIPVTVVFPYGDTTDQRTWRTPNTARQKLERIFVMKYSLNGTCDYAKPYDGRIGYIRVANQRDSLDPSSPFFAAQISVRCLDIRTIDNTPA